MFGDRFINGLKIYQRLWLMAGLSIAALFIGIVVNAVNLGISNAKAQGGLDTAKRITVAVDTAREAQVDFKIQVQEWKNTLLRGSDPAMFIKYWESFTYYEKKVQTSLRKLEEFYNEFDHPLLDAEKVKLAIREQEELGKIYRTELYPYIIGYAETKYTEEDIQALLKKAREKAAAKGMKEPELSKIAVKQEAGDAHIISGILKSKLSPYEIDNKVRGIDRKPTEYIDTLVEDMMTAQSEMLVDIEKQSNQNFYIALLATLVIMAIITVFVALISVLTINSIRKPINTTIDIFGEISGENFNNPIETKRVDEIGEMWRALDNMQRTLRERTEALNAANADLEKTLVEVRKLKEEQDGDYFLTSLLQKPLSSNYAKSDNFRVDFVLEQKKKFTFRKYEKELGGDINMAHTIELQDHRFNFILNGDAMGKSIQGAGGALVLGSVLLSIIERTRLSPDVKKQYPERWLKNTFVELHKVFESFDGSMLMSLTMALLDEQTGAFYSINAEHPNIVLYRDKKASFIETGEIFRKLGTLGVSGNLYVNVMKLLPGDILFMGSDGRDDILLGYSENGNRIINEDENLFLRLVEKTDGNLEDLMTLIKSQGELTDDLSLIRIAYESEVAISKSEGRAKADVILEEYHLARAEGSAANALQALEKVLSVDPTHPEALRRLAQHALAARDYEKAALFSQRYIHAHPEDTEFLYVAAYAAKMTRDDEFLQFAAESGERMRMRNRKHVKNLANLIDVHILRGDKSRAARLLEELRTVDSEHKAISLFTDKV